MCCWLSLNHWKADNLTVPQKASCFCGYWWFYRFYHSLCIPPLYILMTQVDHKSQGKELLFPLGSQPVKSLKHSWSRQPFPVPHQPSVWSLFPPWTKRTHLLFTVFHMNLWMEASEITAKAHQYKKNTESVCTEGLWESAFWSITQITNKVSGVWHSAGRKEGRKERHQVSLPEDCQEPHGTALVAELKSRTSTKSQVADSSGADFIGKTLKYMQKGIRGSDLNLARTWWKTNKQTDMECNLSQLFIYRQYYKRISQ